MSSQGRDGQDRPSSRPLPPSPLGELTVGLARLAAILTANDLGLFEALGWGPCDEAALVRRLGALRAGVTALLDVLGTASYVERAGSGWQNAPVARAWLTSESVADYRPGRAWGAEVWRLLAELPSTIRLGSPARTMYQLMSERPELGRTFARYMRATAMLEMSRIVDLVSLPAKARRLLDLGGSHGLYSVGFLRRYPSLTATVADLPVALVQAKETIRTEPEGGRLRLWARDYLTEDLGTDWDVVLAFSLLHNHTVSDNRLLLAKVAQALRPGGILVVQDFLRDGGPDAFHAAFSLLMFNQNGTRTYGSEEVALWLGEARLHLLYRHELGAGPGSVLTAIRRD